jgi:RimJ/RimL family protein N-acetyltransferase
MRSDRLEVRPAREEDRARFVELFGDPEFMVFSDGVEDEASANARFDGMLADVIDVPFAKQPVIELATNTIVGYSGVAWFDFDWGRHLEYGYRLVPEARGRGYATEAGTMLLAVAEQTFRGELFAMIDPQNDASHNVITKLGFEFWKQDLVNGYLDDLFRRSF